MALTCRHGQHATTTTWKNMTLSLLSSHSSRIKSQGGIGDECLDDRYGQLYAGECQWKWWGWKRLGAGAISSRRFQFALGSVSDSCHIWLLNEWLRLKELNLALTALLAPPILESPEYVPTTQLPGWARTVEELQRGCTDLFSQRPCQLQSEIAFQLLQGKMLVSISATGSGKSYIFWLPMNYEDGMMLIIMPLKKSWTAAGWWIFWERVHIHVSDSWNIRRIP